MSLIIFHRSHTKRGNSANLANKTDAPSKAPKISSPTPPAGFEVIAPPLPEASSNQQTKPERPDGLSEFKYQVKEVEKSVRVTLEAKYLGLIPVKETFRIPQQPWSMFNVFYQPSTGKIEVVNSTAFNPTRSHVENSAQNFIAKMVVTDTETLLYLRGRIPNIQGFKNIIVNDEQDSAAAFRHYSSKVKRFIEDINERRSSEQWIFTSRSVIWKLRSMCSRKSSFRQELSEIKTCSSSWKHQGNLPFKRTSLSTSCRNA